MARRAIEPRPAVELETVSLRLPAHLINAVDDYAKYLGGSSDRTYVITRAIELALERDTEFRKQPAAKAPRPVAAAARGAA